MHINSDIEYNKYLKEKTLDELIEISESIDKNFNRSRYNQIKERITHIKRLRHLGDEYIPRTRISSSFPKLWLYVLAPVMILLVSSVSISLMVAHGISSTTVAPLLMIAVVIASVLMFRRYRDVEVDNDFLYISDGKTHTKVPRSDIRHVSENTWLNIRPITIYFKQGTPCGDSMVFVPKMILRNPFKTNSLIDALSKTPPKRLPKD